MIIKPTKLNGLVEIDLEEKKDERGYFMRTLCQEELAQIKRNINVVQINRSYNKEKGTIRGLHFQKKPKEEDKFVQVLKGSIFDVVVDLRSDSPTFKKWLGFELNERNNKMLFIPRGFAHGFQTLDDESEIEYFMTEFYTPLLSSGIRFDDPSLKINWPLLNPLVSQKDLNLPILENLDLK